MGAALAICGTSSVAPGWMRLGSMRLGFKANHSDQRAPLPRCWRASFQSESPGRTVMVMRESMGLAASGADGGRGAAGVGGTVGAILLGEAGGCTRATASFRGATATCDAGSGAAGATGDTFAGVGNAGIATRDAGICGGREFGLGHNSLSKNRGGIA